MRSLARFYAGCSALFPGQHGRVFTASPALANPPKRDSVVQGMRYILFVAEKSGNPACGRGLFIPHLKTGGFQARFSVKQE